MPSEDGLFGLFSRLYESQREVEMSLEGYLKGCADDPAMLAGPAERMLTAIGEPQMVDTSLDSRLGRIFMNRTIKVYPAFSDFFGMEETIERIVGFFRHAAQGLEERKQVLYLLGPVGGGKSSLAERLKLLMEKCPIYVAQGRQRHQPGLREPARPVRSAHHGARRWRSATASRCAACPASCRPGRSSASTSSAAISRKFSVVRMMPSRLRQICISKTEPGDENNQDVSSLVGKVDIRKLEFFSQNDPDAYSYSGGLNRTTQGILEFVEMFKAPIKMLHPLLTATQESNYTGTENIGGIPFNGIILAHSNEAEWQTFKNNKNNEAFIDRISVVKVPYCLRVAEERKIYEKLLETSELVGGALRAGHAGDAGAVQRAVAPQGARELEPLLQDAGL